MLTIPRSIIKSSTNDFPFHKRVIVLHQLPSAVSINDARPAGKDMISVTDAETPATIRNQTTTGKYRSIRT